MKADILTFSARGFSILQRFNGIVPGNQIKQNKGNFLRVVMFFFVPKKASIIWIALCFFSNFGMRIMQKKIIESKPLTKQVGIWKEITFSSKKNKLKSIILLLGQKIRSHLACSSNICCNTRGIFTRVGPRAFVRKVGE